MSYKEQLTPWCIIRHLPNLQRIVVCRFRRRNDAEDHLRLIRRLCPNVAFSIIFDLPLDSAKGTAIAKQPTQAVEITRS